jgi:hypothetical protein
MGEKMRRFLEGVDNRRDAREYKREVKATYDPKDRHCWGCGSGNTYFGRTDYDNVRNRVSLGILGGAYGLICRDCNMTDPNKRK